MITKPNTRILGNILIGLGILVFLAAVYDALRPFFPERASYDFIGRLRSSLDQTSRPARPSAAPRAASPRRAPSRPVLGEGLITHGVHQTGGSYEYMVWALKPEKVAGETIKIEAAHAADGAAGGFWLVAFADTTGDGHPDRSIARSDYLTVETAGEWSSLEFEAPKGKRIFVGLHWPLESDTAIFRQSGVWPLADGPFEDRFYHIIRPGDYRTAGPAYTNLRVSFP